jgi:hypothetical protein
MGVKANRRRLGMQGWPSRVIVGGLGWCVLLSVWATDLARTATIQVGTAVQAVGKLVVVRADGIEERLEGSGSLPLYEGDMVKTDSATEGLLEFAEGIQVAVNENTAFTILSRWEQAKGVTRVLRLKQGELWVKTSKGPNQFEVETPVATAAIRETEFDIKVQPDGETTLTVVQGIVEFGTAFGTCPIKPATISYGVRGKKCTKPAPTDVTKAISWTSAIVGPAK